MAGAKTHNIKTTWIREVGATFRHEWRQLVHAPLTYVFQAGFLIALSICIFLIAGFFRSDEATVRMLLTFLVWVGMVFVPALGMRACQDGSGGTELLLTLPLRVSAIVVGKFAAGYCLLLITLGFTFPFIGTVYYLGEPDPGVIVSSYLGAALLLAAFYALTLMTSAMFRDETSAFIGGLFLLFLFVLAGWDVPQRILKDGVSAHWLDTIARMSPKTWLDTLSRGVIDFPAVVYFVLVVLLCLFAAAYAMSARRWRYSNWQIAARYCIGIILGVILLSGVMHVVPAVPWAIDLTKEREFSLHSGTLDVLEGLPPETKATFYFSTSESTIPSNIRTHARRVKSLLSQMVSASDGQLSLVLVDPQPDTDEELNALSNSIQRVPMSSGDQFYFGALFEHEDRVIRIPYFDIRRDRMIEYDLAVALQSLGRERIPRLGILSPLLAPETAAEDRPGLSFMSELRRTYDLAVVPYFASELPDGLDVLLLIQPPILQKDMLYEIDQFLMAGGSVVVLLDPYVRFDRGVNNAVFDASDEINDLSDLLRAYGIDYQHKEVVGDLYLAAEVAKPDGSAISYPYWLRLNAAQLSASHPVSASLNELLLAEAGAFDIADLSNVESIITTTEKSGIRSPIDFTDTSPDQLASEFKADNRQRTLALVKSGTFESAYSKMQEQRPGYMERSGKSAQLFAIADTDWIFDPFSSQSVTVGEQNILRPLNDNIAFLLNILEFAGGDSALLSIRSRGQLKRPFEKVHELMRKGRDQYQERETVLATQLSALESQPDGKEVTPLADGSEKEQQLLTVRRELRSIRRSMRESVDQLGRGLSVINLISGPILVALFACWIGWRRRRGKDKDYSAAS